MILDVTLEIPEDAFQLLRIIRSYNLKDIIEDANIFATAWYNQKEHGICVRLESKKNKNSSIIVFGVLENSEDTFVDTWSSNKIFKNPPTPKELSNKTRKDRQTFRTPQMAAHYVMQQIRSMWKEQNK